MAISRRSVLKVVAATGAASMSGALPVRAAERAEAPPDAVGLLYDSTRCIGCKSCVVACNENAGLEQDTRSNPLYNAPPGLNDRAKTVIKLFKGDDGRVAFYKANCMHCIDPACANACMLGAFQKREGGAVTWDPSRCIGCRYCQVACPFNVPKFEWNDPTPRIVKCDLCENLRTEGKEPACTSVCPAKAVVFGTREELLADARARMAAHPGRYQPKIFGETEGGGTQCLVLAPSNVDYQELGLPDLGDEPTAELARTVQHSLYKGFVAPVALYGLFAAVMWRNRRRDGADARKDQAGEEEAS